MPVNDRRFGAGAAEGRSGREDQCRSSSVSSSRRIRSVACCGLERETFRVGEPFVGILECNGLCASDLVEACQTNSPEITFEIDMNLDVRHQRSSAVVGGCALAQGARRPRAPGPPHRA